MLALLTAFDQLHKRDGPRKELASFQLETKRNRSFVTLRSVDIILPGINDLGADLNDLEEPALEKLVYSINPLNYLM